MTKTLWIITPFLVFVFAGLASAQSLPPLKAGEELKPLEGNWHVLIAQRNHKNLAEREPTMHGSNVTIGANRLEWGPNPDGKPWLVAQCKLAAPLPEADAKKQFPPRDPHELLCVTTGSESPNDGVERFARWKQTDYGVVFFCIHIADQNWPTPNHKNGYHGWGAGTILLVLTRDPVSPHQPADPAKDAKRMPDKWQLLTELDDSQANRTAPGGLVEITADRVLKIDNRGKPQMSGPYQLLAAAGQRGRMDITLSEHGMSLGRCPSLYSFCGDDLLFIVYPESGWKRDLAEADRQPPSELQSDGDRNMWILRRSSSK